MSSVSEMRVEELRAVPLTPVPSGRVAWHRIRAVRQQQGVSLRRAAHQLRSEMRAVRHEEEETTDLSLSRVYAWQQVLEVPVADLLVECNNGLLSAPVLERARMIRLMKTVAAILEKAESLSIRRLTQTLSDQLIEMMPELEGVSPWHSVGQRRSLQEFGRIAERVYSDDLCH